MLENHCTAGVVIYETRRKSEREQQGDFEPIYCLFTVPKSWRNLLAHVKIGVIFMHAGGICVAAL